MRRKEFTAKRGGGDASGLSVGIAVSRFNEDITGALLTGAQGVLREWRVKEENISILRVSGSFELPFAAQKLAKSHGVDVIIALGCIIKGDTRHDEYLAQAVFAGLTRVSLDEQIPVGLGVLTTNNLSQARARVKGAANHGAHAAVAALEAALL